MFAGIGGFRSGLSHYGDFFVPVGYCEIDPYAKRAYEAIYEPKGEIYFEDARGIVPESLPDIDLICGGFPCQSFSIAGKRGGFEDARGTLFFEIARIARVKRPHFLLLENVPGLLSHDGCRTFATILGTLDELGYHVAWQVLNSANFGVPQFRKRVLLVGYLGEESGGEILSFTEANPKTIVKRFGGRQGDRVYDGNGLSCTLTSSAGGFAGNTGLYFMDMNIEAPDKTVGHGMTAIQDLENPAEVWKFILELCQDIGHRLYVFNKKATGIAIAIRDKNLFTKQWQCGLPVSTQSPSVIAKEAFSLFLHNYDWTHPIRSITVRAINLTSLDTPCQLDLFSDPIKVAKAESLDKTIENLRYRFGKKIIRNACLLNNPKMSPHDNPDIIMPTGIPM